MVLFQKELRAMEIFKKLRFYFKKTKLIQYYTNHYTNHDEYCVE